VKREAGTDWKLTHQAQAQNHAAPEANIVESLAAPHPLCPLKHDDRELQHLADKSIASQLLCDAGHDNFMANGANEEGDDGRISLANVGSAGWIDMATQEAVDRHIPLARKLHPVGAVPPVAVEMAVGKARHLGACPKYILEDDEEDEEEG